VPQDDAAPNLLPQVPLIHDHANEMEIDQEGGQPVLVPVVVGPQPGTSNDDDMQIGGDPQPSNIATPMELTVPTGARANDNTTDLPLGHNLTEREVRILNRDYLKQAQAQSLLVPPDLPPADNPQQTRYHTRQVTKEARRQARGDSPEGHLGKRGRWDYMGTSSFSQVRWLWPLLCCA
jgi:hypothetical protein